ncbi:MAG: phenylalanine--tRNA ligase subunit beta [Planctomycetota bacterium]|jgi:phenylalanyl-tRNA synthetase beta chain
MYTSARWLNDYLDPPLTPEEQADLLTRAGFPLEATETVDGDTRQDFEMTSNRGDCVCHVGLAREIAALSGRSLKLPDPRPPAAGPDAGTLLRVRNVEPVRCPLYTARVIRGVTIGPSPRWLQERLIARGDIPRNNVVDVTNFVLFELGQPTHVFDLAKLKGGQINIRMARADEPFLPIGEEARPVRLASDDLVIADAEEAVAIAGVKGGALSAVTDATTDVVIEAATFDPVSVRTTSRRLGIASDSSYRFERGVHPGQVEHAARRVAELILEFAGGTLLPGVLADGAEMPPRRTVSMRPERCRKLLGVPIDDVEMVESLARLGFEPEQRGDRIHCTVPLYRLDVEREIDLIEEVGRMYGHDRIPVAESLAIRVAPPQPEEMAKRAVHDALVGMGYVETITHSLVADAAAAAFLPPGAEPLRVAYDRAGGEPSLRPSLLPSLLKVRALNRHNGVRQLKLFESAATFCRRDGRKQERVMLTLVADSDPSGAGMREMRGAVARLAQLLRGPGAAVDVRPDGDGVPWLAPGGAVLIDGEPIGHIGLVDAETCATFDLDDPVVVAELELPRLYPEYPPDTTAHALPAFPAIERDVSAIVTESVAWSDVRDVIEPMALEHLEALDFVTTYRGRQIGGGRKSVTFRCRFRAPDRTLQHDEVDPQMKRVLDAMTGELGAEIRS